MGRKNIPTTRTCIFCGGSPTSQEHKFAAWIGRTLPRVQKHYDQHHWSVTKPLTWLRFKTKRSILDARLKVVCKECNNGWMSDLQDLAKPIITPLILGERTTLEPQQVEILATWATMTAMVWEFSQPKLIGAAVPQEERTRFKAQPAPLPNWKFWIGRYFTDKTMDGRHKTARHPSEITNKCDTQLTTIWIGHLFLHIFSSSWWCDYEPACPHLLRALHMRQPISFPFAFDIDRLQGTIISSGRV